MAMRVRQKRETSMLVIWVVFGIMMLALSFLGSRLWKLQVQGKSGFDEVFRNQSVRRVRLPAVRGTIYDTNEKVLADSVPNYCIAIYTEEMRAPPLRYCQHAGADAYDLGQSRHPAGHRISRC